MVLIPISTIGLFASMMSIFFVGLGISFEWLFTCTQWIIELFAACARYFAALPNSSIHPISFSAIEACLVATIVCVYIQFPFILNRKTVIAGLLVCLSWSAFRIYNENKSEHKAETIFISNGKRSALLSIQASEVIQATVYPNPTNDEINIKTIYDGAKTIDYMVYNILGQLIYKTTDQNVYSYTKQINLSSLAAGVYLVLVSDGDSKMVYKIVKQ